MDRPTSRDWNSDAGRPRKADRAGSRVARPSPRFLLHWRISHENTALAHNRRIAGPVLGSYGSPSRPRWWRPRRRWWTRRRWRRPGRWRWWCTSRWWLRWWCAARWRLRWWRQARWRNVCQSHAVVQPGRWRGTPSPIAQRWAANRWQPAAGRLSSGAAASGRGSPGRRWAGHRFSPVTTARGGRWPGRQSLDASLDTTGHWWATRRW